jgi:hypothetical protein
MPGRFVSRRPAGGRLVVAPPYTRKHDKTGRTWPDTGVLGAAMRLVPVSLAA